MQPFNIISASVEPPSASTPGVVMRNEPSPRTFRSVALFGETPEIRIEHLGQEYRLRQTRNGKLILTK